MARELFKPGWLLAVLLLLVAGAAAESLCRVRFAVAEAAPRLWGRWPEDAKAWWNSAGQKKFPGLCEAGAEDADFVIEWRSQRSPIQYSIPKADGSWTRQPEPILDCSEGPQQTTCYPGPDNQEICYTTPGPPICTARVSLPQPTEWETVVTTEEKIWITLYRAEQNQFHKVKSFSKAGHSSWARPGRAAFTRAMKELKAASKR
jgi:hypothetical protein